MFYDRCPNSLLFVIGLKDRAVFLKGAKAEDPYDPIISDIAAKLGAIASLWNGVGCFHFTLDVISTSNTNVIRSRATLDSFVVL